MEPTSKQEMADKHWKEECAVVGVYNCKNAVALAHYSLFSMQHRGQEASGISYSDGEFITTKKGSGLVMDVFADMDLSKADNLGAIGHNRYSTAGSKSANCAQPIYAKYELGEISVVHNGNLTNANEIRESLAKSGTVFQSDMDTEIIIHLIANSKKDKLVDRIVEAMLSVNGAYALVFLSRSKMFAMRDKFGLRPLSLAKVQNKDGSLGYVVASESCAFDIIGAEYVRDIEPGELIIFSKGDDGNADIASITLQEPKLKQCVFEYIYFARPDSVVFNQNVYIVRKRLGVQLAKEHKIQADVAIPVPDSGLAAALGYSEESGIKFELGLIRNHYVGRTFIEPTQSLRELKVKLKLSTIRDVINGKRVVVIDDSLVRGTTSKSIIALLWQSGAVEVHMLISSPSVISPCYYGVDTPSKGELISAVKSEDEVRDFIGATSLGFLSMEGLKSAVGSEKYDFCQACFDGSYLH